METIPKFEGKTDINAMRTEAYKAIRFAKTEEEAGQIRTEYIDRRKELLDEYLRVLSEKIDSANFEPEEKEDLKYLLKEDSEERYKNIVMDTPRFSNRK